MLCRAQSSSIVKEALYGLVRRVVFFFMSMFLILGADLRNGWEPSVSVASLEGRHCAEFVIDGKGRKELTSSHPFFLRVLFSCYFFF